MADLKQLGEEIDITDWQLINLLAQRLALVKAIGEYKKEHSLPIIRPEVEEGRLALVQELAREEGMNVNFISALFYLIIAESCRVQIQGFQQ